MNEKLQDKLSEVTGTNNISYILNDNNDFSVTGYKVMQNQSYSSLLRCAKIMYNGKIKLVYIVGETKPLSYVATRLGINEMNAVLFSLIQCVMDIKSNGFFRAENLELDYNKIFVDTVDYSVHLIYYPLSGAVSGEISAFENEFRVALINLFNSFPVFKTPQFQRICIDISNGALPLEDIIKIFQSGLNGNNFSQRDFERGNVRSDYFFQRFKSNSFDSEQRFRFSDRGYQRQGFQNQRQFQNFQNQDYQSAQHDQQPVMSITAINSPVQIVLTINQPEYLIGKNPNMVNGAITHNPAISRVHCKITYSKGKYYLTDMGSANGTYLNQRRLENQQAVEINNGDYLKLANSDFVISF